MRHSNARPSSRYALRTRLGSALNPCRWGCAPVQSGNHEVVSRQRITFVESYSIEVDRADVSNHVRLSSMKMTSLIHSRAASLNWATKTSAGSCAAGVALHVSDCSATNEFKSVAGNGIVGEQLEIVALHSRVLHFGSRSFLTQRLLLLQRPPLPFNPCSARCPSFAVFLVFCRSGFGNAAVREGVDCCWVCSWLGLRGRAGGPPGNGRQVGRY